eukprot:3055059-Alexandrium_andersonii.AAC.1
MVAGGSSVGWAALRLAVHQGGSRGELVRLGWAWGGLGHGALLPSAASVPSTHWDELARAVGARV